MSEFDRRLKVKPRTTSGQCSIENAGSIPYEIWDAEYVNMSGFCGPHSPHTFAAAPVMLEALRAAEIDMMHVAANADMFGLTSMINFANEAADKIRAAIAAAEGGE